MIDSPHYSFTPFAPNLSVFPAYSIDMENAGGEYFGPDVQILTNDQIGSKKKESNFTPEEDLFLCEAWCATSGDSIRANDQSSMTFCERVGEEYLRRAGSNSVPRLGKSLQQRWSRIRTSVTKFCAILKSINDRNPSGYGGQEKITMAVLTYNNEMKDKFKFLHCRTELRNAPKWNSEGITGHRTRNMVMYSQQPPNQEPITLDDNDDSPVPMPVPLERPIGQKLAKLHAKKRKAKDIEAPAFDMPELFNKSQELFRDIHADKVGLMNKQQGVVEEMLAIKREKLDAEIMFANPSTLTDLGREYLNIMQMKVFNRV